MSDRRISPAERMELMEDVAVLHSALIRGEDRDGVGLAMAGVLYRLTHAPQVMAETMRNINGDIAQDLVKSIADSWEDVLGGIIGELWAREGY